MLSDDFDILLSGAYFHRNDDSFEAYTYADKFGSTPVFSAMGARVTILSQDVYQSYEPQNRTNVYSASARVRLGIGSGDLISISAYQNAKTYLMPDFVSADTPIFNFAANDTGRSFSQEVYYRGNVGRLTYLLGANYFDQSARFDPLYVFFGTTPGSVSNQYADSTGFAGYAEATYNVTDAFSLTGGVRISTEKKTQDRLENFDGAGNLLSSAPRSSKRWNNEAFKAVAQYQLADTMLYAKFESGFKSGSVVVSQPGLFIPPETIDAYEVGLKTDFMDRKARFNVAGFYYKYKNLQVQYTDVATGTTLVESADTARIWGLEGQFMIMPVRNFTLDFGATYLNSKYTDFLSSGVFIPNSVLVGPGTPGNSNVTADVTGNKIVKTPPLTFNASIEWKKEMDDGSSLDANLSLYYSDKYYFDITNRIYQDNYATVSGQIRYNFPGDRFAVAVYGRNITDTKYLATSTPTAFGDQAQLELPCGGGPLRGQCVERDPLAAACAGAWSGSGQAARRRPAFGQDRSSRRLHPGVDRRAGRHDPR